VSLDNKIFYINKLRSFFFFFFATRCQVRSMAKLQKPAKIEKSEHLQKMNKNSFLKEENDINH